MKRRHERREKWKVHFSHVHPCLYLSFIDSFITWMKIDHLSISFIKRMDEICSLLDGHLSISFWIELVSHVIHHMDGKVALG
jgi:hypothetical protein